MKKSPPKLRERIKVVRIDTFKTDDYPIDTVLATITEYIFTEISKVKSEYDATHKDIKVCFDPDSEEYSYPGDIAIPALVFTGVLKG